MFLFVACNSSDPAGTPSRSPSPDSSPSDPTRASATETAAPIASPELETSGPDAARTLAQIIQLADVIGPRVAGTDAAEIAAEYIAAQFEQSGYSVETAEFSFETAAVRISSVSIEMETLDALALTGSSADMVTGRAVFVGTADAASIDGLDLEGASAVALRDQRRFDDKMTTVSEAGAAGLVIINTGRGTFNGTLGQEAAIPVVGVGSESGDALIAAAEAAIEISIDAPESTVLTGRNVIARWAESGGCAVLVGGHYDTVAGVAGANDNSSGTAHVLELARAFAADGLDEGLCFAAFDAEEFGLFGSAELAGSLRLVGGLPMYMVNLDVTGTGDDVGIIGAGALVGRALDIAARIGVPAVESSLPPNTDSDHASFRDLGVQVLFFTSGAFREIHTPDDSTELIQEEQLVRVGNLAFAVISSLLLEIASD